MEDYSASHPCRHTATSHFSRHAEAWGAASCSHVVDLAEGHVAALKNIESRAEPYCDPINLGTGRGTSVLEMIKVRRLP